MLSNYHEDEVKWMQRATRDDLYSGSFHEAIGSILALAQFFGVMPVVGVKSKSPIDLKFQWKSLRTIYSIVLFILMMIYGGMTLWVAFSGKINFDRISKIR